MIARCWSWLVAMVAGKRHTNQESDARNALAYRGIGSRIYLGHGLGTAWGRNSVALGGLLVVAAGGAACGNASAAGPSPIADGAPSLPGITLGVSAHQAVPAWAPFQIVRRDAGDLAWVDGVLAQGRTPIILVSYGDKAAMPARVAAAFERYPEAWIEVWNEPNDPMFWGEAPDPEAYVRMFAACRAAAPGARLIGPSTGGGAMDWAFMERAARAGLGRYLTAASIHPYGVGHPDQLQPAVARVRALFGVPVVVSEWGFNDGPDQAELVTAAVRAAARAGVGFLILYSWADHLEGGPAQGLTNGDGSPRPALQRLMAAR